MIGWKNGVAAVGLGLACDGHVHAHGCSNALISNLNPRTGAGACAYSGKKQKMKCAFSSLSQGDPTYLVVNNDSKIEKYGINAVCTHLGCVVPWVPAENKFKCPCHGSQYNNEGEALQLGIINRDLMRRTVISRYRSAV